MTREIISREMTMASPKPPSVIVGAVSEPTSVDSGARTAIKVGLVAGVVYLAWSYSKGL